jgi:hypothetical protein
MERKRMEAALIKTDKETLARLKKAAGGKPVAAYVRELSYIEPTPVEKRLGAIEKDIGDSLSTLLRIYDTLGIVLNAMGKTPELNKVLDEQFKSYWQWQRESAELEELANKAHEMYGDKLSKVLIWDARMYREVIDNPTLLDDSDWIKSNQKVPSEIESKIMTAEKGDFSEIEE